MYLIKRAGYYHVEYFDKLTGKIRRISTKTKLKKEAVHFLTEFKGYTNNSKKHVEPLSLSQFKKRYVEFVRLNATFAYLRSIELSFKMLEAYTGDIKLIKISFPLVERFLLDVYERASYAARLYLSTLKAAFNKAIGWEYIVVNPFTKIKLPKSQKNLPQFLTQEQFTNLISFENDLQFQRLYVFAFNTGLRLGELSNMLWKNVDTNTGTLFVRNNDSFTTKSKAERIIPLNGAVREIIRVQQTLTLFKSEFVFANENGGKLLDDNISKRFKKCVNAYGKDSRIHFHTLRHSFASNLAQKGVSLYHIKNLLGHSSITTTEIYAHINNENLRDAVDKLL